MSDVPATADGLAAVPRTGQSAGALLRDAREAAGVHIGALAVALKVPVKKLEALEADRIDLLPDAVFARALAASVCRTLKIDPAEVLRLLPESGRPSLEFTARRAAAVVQSRSSEPGRALLSRLSLPVLVGVGLLVLATIALLVFPAFDDAMPEVDTPVTHGAAESPAVPAATPEAPAAVVSPGAGSVEVVPGAPAASAPVTAAPAAAVPASTAVAAVGNGPLNLVARSSTWVQVTDAAGASPLRRTLAEGESVAVSGALPLSVVVGRADAIQVTVRGEPLDMAPVTRNNIARFQVK